MLVIADEDRNGVNPTFPNPPGGGLQYGQLHLDAIRAAGYSADLWDTDTQGVPHDLGVLSHYKAVVWYMGDNRITQDPEDFFTDTPFGPAARHRGRRARAVPDDGGARLPQRGRQADQRRRAAQFSGLPGITDVVGGLYYGLNGDPEAECVITTVQGLFDELPAAGQRLPPVLARRVHALQPRRPERRGRHRQADRRLPRRRCAGTPTNPLDEAGVFQPTSEVLPVDEFPQFTSQGAAQYDFTGRPVHAGRGDAATRARVHAGRRPTCG